MAWNRAIFGEAQPEATSAPLGRPQPKRPAGAHNMGSSWHGGCGTKRNQEETGAMSLRRVEADDWCSVCHCRQDRGRCHDDDEMNRKTDDSLAELMTGREHTKQLKVES